MAYAIILEGPNGQREVAEGKPYRMLPGEKVIGSRYKLVTLWEAFRSDEGLGIGDLVAAGTKLIGIQPCSRCNKDRQALNKYRINLV